MDERHWWFATKLQETFHIGVQDSPTMLEDFMAEQTTLDYINDFLAAGGHTKLFFYCAKPNVDSLVSRRMFVTNTTAKLREVLNEECICLYFLRSDADHVIDSNRVEKEVFCGEIKESPLLTLSLLVNSIFVPVLRAQRSWECNEETVSQFFTQFEKLTSTLSEYAAASVAPQPILKRSGMQVSNDFKQNRAAAINPIVLAEYEALVADWSHTIENILCDGIDERVLDGVHGPLSESHIWHRRQKHLIGITEQLKTKECKGVIGILITGKSKVLKRWKFIDASITDAFNETKDKVKYLDTLKRYFEQLYSPAITVSTLCNNVLPAIMATVRQLDTISRYYTKTGYLGLLFTKVTNQLANACRQYINTSITKGEQDRLWLCIEEEVNNSESPISAPTFVKLPKGKKKQGGGEVTLGTNEDNFIARLQACLILQKQYRDMLRTLRDNFGASHSPAVMSNNVTPAGSPMKRSYLQAPVNTSTANTSQVRLSSQVSTQAKFKDSDSSCTPTASGVSLGDEETIFNALEVFCTRVRNMIDIINTLGQFTRLCKAAEDLPRLPKDALVVSDENEEMIEEEEDQIGEITNTLSEGSVEEEEEYIEEPPSAACELSQMVQDMKDSLITTVTARSFLDTRGKNREMFERGYTDFVNNVRKVETYVCQYLQGIFTLKFSSERALHILSKFDCVIHRVGLKPAFSDKYVAVFSNFDDELEEVQNLYETQKESPPLSRNAPIVSGAISWSRGLLRKIEEPMKMFKENKFVTSLRDFGRIVKFYNRIATALVKFESLWLTMWKSRIESARVALKLPLLAHHFETKELVVNADERVIELIQECKGLLRFDIQLPENAMEVLRQERRFKNYKQHLEFLLKDYSDICSLVPVPLTKLLLPHTESVIQYLQPGLSNLTWNSMNIDAYLHQVHLANMRLRNIVETVNKVVDGGIHKNIRVIEKSTLFDVELAYSRRWTIDSFKDELKEAIKDKQTQLSTVFKTIEKSIQDVISIATQNRSTSPLSPSHTPHLSVSPRSGRHTQHESAARAVTTSVSGLTDEGVISEIFVHYCGLAHRALVQCIAASLQVFYRCVCPVEILRDREQNRDNSRPSSAASNLSSSSEWSVIEPTSCDLLQFEVDIEFNIPDIVIAPTLSIVQSAVSDVAVALVDICQDMQWWAIDTKETLHTSISNNTDITSLVQAISDIVTTLQNAVDRQLLRFRRYDFLWKEDMHGLYEAFVDTEPTTVEYRREVDRLQSIENDILGIPGLLTVGSISLNTTPIKDSLHGLAVAWKIKYSSELHEEAKADLQQLVEYREEMKERLSHKVVTLENLNETLKLLQELNDKDNTIDEVYLPVENGYNTLREYNLSLPRQEVEEVKNLRDRWQNLMDLAEQVRYELMVEKRNIFEQELDKDVKRFVVEVIQFRNSFDSQGPGVVGVGPANAVERLHNFQQAYSEYEAKRKILDAVQLIFGVTPTLFPELDRTGEELVLLGLLYGLFQQYISFDESFRNKLWADVDLIKANREVEDYWQQCLKLPPRIQEWQAYKAMKSFIEQYLNVFPILHQLASKEIRNRHWLQVMSVTGSSFQLEANVFKLSYLLDIELIKHQIEIKEICSSASKELELEVKMRSTEEEWTEQVLLFDKLKEGTLYCLSNTHTEGLLELLEDAQSSLAVMLTSKYIGPLRHEAAGWAIKLKEIGEVLEQWLAVQDFWRYLKTVFTDNVMAKELPQECARFARIDKSYMKMTKRAHDTKNVLQCCVGGDVPKIQVLKHMYEELDVCFKSLHVYLDAKRKAFPRFYFVSDPDLLAILSQPYTLESVKPHLKSLFVDVCDILLTTRAPKPLLAVKLNEAGTKSKKSTVSEDDRLSFTRPSHFYSSEQDLPQSSSRNLSSAIALNVHNWRKPTHDAVAIVSEKGEELRLKKEVFLTGGVELWLNELLKVVQETIYDSIENCIVDVKTTSYIDEIAQKYPPQVAYLGLLFIWTRECEVAITDIRIDRKAIPNAIRRFWAIVSRLPSILVRYCWRNSDQRLTMASQANLEGLLAYGMYLRDIIDDLGKRKLRDITDFEWRRNTRFYGNTKRQESDDRPRHLLHMLEKDLDYGYEFYGSRLPVTLTPGTEKYFLTLSLAKLQFRCGAIVGACHTGKTETAKGLAQMLGQYFLSLSCTPNMDYGNIAKILSGLAQEGCWGIFDEFHRASPKVVEVVIHYVQAVTDALRAGKNSCFIEDGKEIIIKPSFNVILTANSQHFTMTTELKAYFRSVAMVMPDISLILRTHCAGQGLKSPKVLADRLTMVAKICQDQLSNITPQTFSLSSLISVVKATGKQRLLSSNNQAKLQTMPSEICARPVSHSNTSPLKSSKVVEKDRKPPTPSQVTQTSKLDHYLTIQLLQECIGPRLSQEDLGIFNSVVRDVFLTVPGVPQHTEQGLKERREFESVLIQNIAENGLVARPSWFDKIIQLYHLSAKNNGILLAGCSGAGKTSCVATLVETLSRCSLLKHGNTGSQVHTHKLQRIHPLSVSDLSLMFGCQGPGGEWIDGIFTSSWKKANKAHNVHRTTTWLCLDGPLHEGWAENLCSIFDDAKYLTLDNCERLHLTDDVKVVFETDDMSSASPAIVSRTAVVFMDDDVLGWRPLAEAWLNNRTTTHRECIEKTFNNTVDTICQLVLHDLKPLVKISEVGLFSTCLALLQALFENNTDIAGDLHVERLCLFSLIWSFGILLPIPEQTKFSEALLSMSSGLPDYDQHISIFDYYVDESGEWELWKSRVPDESYFDAADLLGEVFVETDHTIRVRFLMELARMSGRNILLVGPSGSGKSCIMNDFLDKQVTEDKTLMVRRYVFSGNSSAAGLQRFIESNIHHRQGYDYGARGGKSLCVFIEDLNLPTPDKYGVQDANELLRQVVGDQALYELQKPFERRQLEDIFVVATLNMSFRSPAVGKKCPISERLKRHFAVFRLPTPTPKTMFAIVTCVLEANMSHNQGMGLPQELHEQIVEATCSLIQTVQDVLRPSPTPGRYHYQFNLQDVARVFQGLKTCPEEMRADEDYVVSLWQHEVQRVMGDRISRLTDLNWLERNIKNLTKEFFPDKPANSPPQLFVTFPTDINQFCSGRTAASSKANKATHQAVDSLDEVVPCINAYLKRYNDEFSANPLHLMLSPHCISHIVRVHRILSIKNRGNVLLIGSIGSRLSHVAALALYMLDYPLHPVDCSHLNTFLDGIRSAVRRAGCDGKTTTLKFTERDLIDERYLDAINSLLISGEYSPLFSEDETNSLLQALMPTIKRKFSNFLTDPMKFFLTRVKRNLHIILCLQPTHSLISSSASHYPGILSGCHINWIHHCGEEGLIGKADHFLQEHNMFQVDISPSLKPSVISTLASIHTYVLRMCHQVPSEIGYGTTTNNASPTDEQKDLKPGSCKDVECNDHYSKNLVKERIALAHRGNVSVPIDVFIGPKTFDRFLHCFKNLLSSKQKTLKELIQIRSASLLTISQAHRDAETLKEYITKTRAQYEEANVKTASLLVELTAKSTTLERLKATLGVGSDILRSFIEMIDNEMEYDDDVILPDDEKDELDEEFERMKLAKLKSKKAKTHEEITIAKREEDRLKVDVNKAKEQVLLWQERLDRSCCERFKAIQNPPTMVSMVMLMTMVLLGKHEFSPFSKPDSGHSRFTGIMSDGKCDRTTWKAIQQIMGDSQKFADALHNLDWREGLSDEIVAGIRPFFAKGKDGELAKDRKTVESAKLVSSPDTRLGGITVTAARYSSEDVVILVEYVLALLHYTEQFKPYKKIVDYITNLYAEQEDRENSPTEFDKKPSDEFIQEDQLPQAEPDPELTEDDLPRLEEELSILQDKFDEAVVVKYDLQQEVDSSSERLKVAQQLLQRFRENEKEFRSFVDEYSSLDVILSNCLSASAFLSYCGPLRPDMRKKLVAYFTSTTAKYALPRESKQIFYDMSLCEYLNGKIAIKMFEQMKLATDPLMLDNMCIVNQQDTSNCWPLICDPHCVAQTLVTADPKKTIVKYKDLRSHLETCLMEGTTLFVTDIDVVTLVDDDRFYYVFRHKLSFFRATSPFKLLVGEHEIECQPSFRLFMSTASAAYQVPRQLTAFINVVDICLSREGLEDQLLDRFMELEKPRVHDSRYQNVLESVRLLMKKMQTETTLLGVVIENRNFVRDLATMKKITSMKRSLEETTESISRVEQAEASLLQSREAFRPIARRAAVFFDVIRHMEEINGVYRSSWHQFLKVFDIAIKHSERTAVKAVAERVGHNAFSFAVQGLLEKDKLLFALLSSIEVEDSCGRVNAGDREFLIHPAYGAAVKTAVSQSSLSTSQAKIINAKKPFDWMTDEQYNALQLLAQSFEWFQEPFEKMNKDGRETQWRQLIEHDIPELVALPENLDEKFTPIQRFMVIRAIRPDRLTHASRSFIIQGLGRRYASEIPLDLGLVCRQNDCNSPILLLYDEESSLLETMITDVATKKQLEVVVIHITSACPNQERFTKRTLHKAMQEGSWVVLLDAQNDYQLLDMIDSFISDTKQPEPNFRLWITAKISSLLPSNILQIAVKVVADSPKNIRDNLIRSMSLLDDTTLNASGRAEWPAVLHNICMLHNVVRLRSLFHLVGWNKPNEIRPGAEELYDAIRVAAAEFREQSSQHCNSPTAVAAGKSIQWNGLRYLLSEIVYGKYVSDEFDRHSLSAMVDYWISPAAVKKEFEASRMKYRLPSVFFAGNARLPTLLQSLESLPANVLDVPEACGLHSSPETMLATDQYIFSHLNWIYDRMQTTETLTQVCVETDYYTPTQGIAVVSGQTHLPGASSIGVEEAGVFASASLTALRQRKDVELYDICNTALAKTPRPWNKESITERFKRGGVTSFSLFVLSEVEQMQKLVQEIRDDLQLIRESASDGIHGDKLPADVLAVADALFHLRIPAKWLRLAGATAPPVFWTLSAWLGDLQSRHVHIDRVLSQGRDRIPAYWLGAFFNPKRLLAIIKQEAVRNFESSGRTSTAELFVFQTEITGRDKDHLREPPLEGMFVYGLHMWGCAWEKTTGDLLDAPPRQGPTPLPVVHITAVPQSEKQSLSDPQRSAVSYSCPCFPSRVCSRDPVVLLDIDNKDVSATRWPLRGLSATLRPF